MTFVLLILKTLMQCVSTSPYFPMFDRRVAPFQQPGNVKQHVSPGWKGQYEKLTEVNFLIAFRALGHLDKAVCVWIKKE